MALSGGWSDLSVGGILLLVCFVIWQAKGPNPLLPLRVLKNRNRAGSFLTIMLAQIGLFGTFLFLTYLLQTVDHFSPVETGLAFLPLMVVNGLAATQLASRLMPHVRPDCWSSPGYSSVPGKWDSSPVCIRALPSDLCTSRRDPLGSRLRNRPGALHQHRHQQCRSP